MIDPVNLQYTTIKDPVPDFIYKNLADFSKSANAYQPQPQVLIDKLAAKFGLPKELFLLTAGADEAIQLFAKAYGNNAFVFTPTYVVYSDVEVFGGQLTRIPSLFNNDFTINTGHIPDATLIYLANPNNPAGFTEKETVLQLVKNNSDAIVVIDEAYGDFADLSVVDQVKTYPNLAVIRSFSKGYGMAGNRIGFVITNELIKSKLLPLIQWCNVSYLSVGAASAALDHEDYYRQMRENICLTREDFLLFLKDRGFAVIESKINAVLMRFSSEMEADRFVKHLNSHQIIVSQGNGNSNIGLDNTFVRIAIGNRNQMGQVKEIVGEYI